MVVASVNMERAIRQKDEMGREKAVRIACDNIFNIIIDEGRAGRRIYGREKDDECWKRDE